jgi:hypothetical protein
MRKSFVVMLKTKLDLESFIGFTIIKLQLMH